MGPATATPTLLPILAEAIDPFWQGPVVSAGRSQVGKIRAYMHCMHSKERIL